MLLGMIMREKRGTRHSLQTYIKITLFVTDFRKVMISNIMRYCIYNLEYNEEH